MSPATFTEDLFASASPSISVSSGSWSIFCSLWKDRGLTRRALSDLADPARVDACLSLPVPADSLDIRLRVVRQLMGHMEY